MMHTHPEETALLGRMVRGDGDAFGKIYEFYQGRIFAFAYRMTKSRDIAEEMVQEIFIRLWEKRSYIEPARNFDAYLKTMAKNHILNFLEKVGRDRDLLEKVKQQAEALRNTAPDQLFEKELQKAYREAVSKLPARRKQVYTLSREENLSYDEIAERLGISRNTVKEQLKESVRFVREYVSTHTDLACLILAICLSK